jgi:hypothetical protein
MADREKPPPHRTPEGAAAAKRREERLATALRANLGRRKAQSRERAGAPPPAPEAAKEGGSG